MKAIRAITTICSIFLLYSLTYCQQYIARMEHFGTRDGLSHQYVTSIVQTADGVLWIGTRDGLNRFDGFRFIEFNPQNSDLYSSVVGYMHLSPEGWICIYLCDASTPGIVSHVQYMDPVTFAVRDADESLIHMVDGVMSNSISYNKGRLCTGRNANVYAFDQKEQLRVSIPDGYRRSHAFMHFIQMSSDDDVLLMDVHKPGQMFRHGETNDLLAQYYWTTRENHTVNYQSRASFLHDTLRQLIWNPDKSTLKPLTMSGNEIRFMDGSVELSFPRRITDVIGSERLFVGTESGFFILSLEALRFRNYFVGEEYGGSLQLTECRGIIVTGDSIFACLPDGLYTMSVSDPDSVLRIAELTRPRCLVLQDHRNLLIGGHNLYHMDPQTRAISEIIRIREKRSGAWGMSLIGSRVYLSHMDGMMFAPYRPDTLLVEDGPYIRLSTDDRVLTYDFVPLPDQSVVLVSSDGLFKSSPDLSAFRRIQFVSSDGSTPAFRHFTHLRPDDHDGYWATALDGGLVRFALNDTSALILNQLDRGDGVPTSTFYCVYPDGLGSVWCSTDLGIVQMDTLDWSFRFYSGPDGIRNKEFNRLSHTMDADGHLYFGGLDGVTAFDPRDFYSDHTRVELNILHVEQYSGWENEIVNKTEHFRKSGRIVLKPSDQFFVLEMGLNDLFQTGQHQYQYRLQEVDEDWLDISGNTLRMHSLSFGDHVVEIRGMNARGIAARNTIRVPVTVLRPIYLRWWFLLGLGLGVILIIREYWLARTRRLRSEAIKLEALVNERTAQIAEQADELRRMQEARSRFFANISHELRTPLTLIKGPVKGLMGGTPSQARQHDYLKIIDYNADLLQERIEDLLLLARSDSGSLVVRKSAVVLNKFLERIVDSFRGMAEDRDFRLVLQNQMPANAVVLADSRKLEHILSNFISNALKYADPHTQVTVVCRHEQDQLVMNVSDQGPGIAEELQGKIFERFYSGSTHDGGAGIGLALSRDLAQAMDGRVWVESAQGEGSTFYLSIPYAMADVEGPDEEVKSPRILPVFPDTHTGDKYAPKILCVEDNRSMRAYLVTELHDCQVTSCDNGVIALQRLEEMSGNGSLPDCIVSDVMMPEMDGFELAQTVRSSAKFSAIPIILLTARAGHDDKLRGLRIGVDDYITKPFDSDELRIRINNLVGRKPVKQEAINEEGEAIVCVDEKWLKSVEERMTARLHERDFTIDRLADEMHMSRSQFYRRIKAYTGLTPHKYLREARLFKAKEILESGDAGTIAQLSSSVGFDDAGYFSRIFAERFGFRPSQRM